MKNIAKSFSVLVVLFLETSSLLSQTPIWTSPAFVNNTSITSGWFAIKYNPLELKFYYYNEVTDNLKIMDGPLSNTAVLDITLGPPASHETFTGTLSYDYSGDGLNDLVIRRSYATPSFRYGFRILDVTNGQTLFTFDDSTHSYYFEEGLPAEINGDGHTEIVIRKTDTEYTYFQYIVYSTNGIPTSISNEINILPKELKLNQNYPNPFNPTTKINYEVPKSGNITLAIYNSVGQIIKTIVSEHKESGLYEATWDGKNEVGNTVATGIYYYQLKDDDFELTKKMILIK